MKKILKKIYTGTCLTEKESFILFNHILYEKLNNIQISAILAIMASRTETYEEIIGARESVIQHMKYFPAPNYSISDIVGTGGDQKNSFNISTVSSIVAAAYGIKIVKMCNINSSSNSGSANLLQKLQVNLKISPKKSRKCLDQFNICFLFANFYLTSFKKISKIRSLLKTKTIFNILGPLLNPAKPTFALIGVYKKDLMPLYAKILSNLQYQRAIIVHSGGIDEATLYDNIYITEINNKKYTEYILSPKDFGLKKYSKNFILEKNEAENYTETIKLFKGIGEPVYVKTVAINVALLMKVLGYNNLSHNTLNILNFINSGKIYNFVLKLSKLFN
ncbi:Anthranilate phosphoribosyltransferase [Buchnera aphidicola (Cinara piceae)]|uniref:Anthranilate phosphoribosyltransferase n=1 Tax=Buchnera aphidicola (Cinara piceae) TaxID=1660043 RepID=A0A803GCL9_9GAMM|nr:anthranilate phosphoribosyltransferase [Buchnera aphidicola]VFP88274.1 Anthranilate phosphoribosyltransferase [Buchnera aphidicola (Cinara piceae)]